MAVSWSAMWSGALVHVTCGALWLASCYVHPAVTCLQLLNLPTQHTISIPCPFQPICCIMLLYAAACWGSHPTAAVRCHLSRIQSGIAAASCCLSRI